MMTSRRGVCACRACIPVLVLTLAVIAHREFTMIPMVPENITLNEDVVFHCSHPDAEFYAWYTNGSLVGNNPPEDITPSFNTLTIIALPRNNNTVIECSALILTPSGTGHFEVRAPSVILVIPDRCDYRVVSTAMRSFIKVPLSQNVTEGVQVRFICQHGTTNTLVWEVDEVLFTNKSSPLNASTFAVSVDGGSAQHVFLVDAKLSYHHTSFVCVAISNGCPQQKTTPALLLIQGPLRAISGVFRDNLANRVGVFYFWEPPSTLNLTGVEPDTVYCVEVYNITCGGKNLIASDCEVMNPIYPASMGDGLDPSYVYQITVTPRSNVPGAVNGSDFTQQEKFMSVEVSPRPVMESSTGVMVEFGIFINDTESERLVKARARSYSIEIVSTDDPQTSVSEVIREGADRVAVLLNKRQRWTYTVFAYGCQLHPVSITNQISTFAVQNVTVISTAPGELEVTASFLTNTSAVGMLAIVYSTENDSDIHYIEARLPQTEIHLTGLSGSVYSTSIFTLEENGLPLDQAAHYLGEISIRRGQESAQTDLKATVQYELKETPSCVNVTCTFLENSTTDCVAVVHQRISQLSSSGLMSIESSHKFTRSGATASGCIPQVDLLRYQIGVVGGKLLMRSPPDHSSSVCSTGCIIGSVFGSIGGCLVIMVTVVIVIGIIYWRWIYSKKRVNLHTHVSVHAQCHEDRRGSDIQLQERLLESTKPAVCTIGDPVEVHTDKPAAETLEEIQDESMQQDPLVPNNPPAPFLGASNNGGVDVPPFTLPLVDGGPEQTSSTAATGEIPVVRTNDTDPANSGNAESSIPSLPTDKEDTVNPKGGEKQLSQQHSLGKCPKVITYPTETTHTEKTAVVAVGMPTSTFQPEFVTRDSTVVSADCSKDQEAMLSTDAATTKDSSSKLFQQKPPRAQMGLPTSIVSRKHLDARDLSAQSVQSSLNNFNKNEWPLNEQPEEEPNGSTNTERTTSL